MPYYLVYRQHGRTFLADDLRAEDPFGLDPATIVERVFELGNTPDVRAPRHTPWPTVGSVAEVTDLDGTYLVAIGRDAQQISVQEVRGDAYDPVE